MSSAAIEHVFDLSAFVAASPSSFHAAAEAARRLEAAGFTELAEADAWNQAAGGHFVMRDGAIIAWVQPENATATTGFHILGSHTDSPSFKLKPKPTTGAHGWLQAGVEVYGGPLLNSWLDRELLLAGRLVLLDGTEVLARTAPMLRFPQLAIHLDRAVNEGLALDKQQHMNPVWGIGDPGQADVWSVLAESAGVDAGADRRLRRGGGRRAARCGLRRGQRVLRLRPTGQPFLDARLAGGAHRPRGRRWPGTTSPCWPPSTTRKSARPPAPGRPARSWPTCSSASAHGLGAAGQDRSRAYADSFCLSADAGHSVHPNYPGRHDPANRPLLGAGPLLKINANQRYATDAVGAALFARLCAQADVPYQEFVSNNQMPCGSTIGPLTATRLGIRTVDVGIPLLSMHSARELCGVEDPLRLAKISAAFFAA